MSDIRKGEGLEKLLVKTFLPMLFHSQKTGFVVVSCRVHQTWTFRAAYLIHDCIMKKEQECKENICFFVTVLFILKLSDETLRDLLRGHVDCLL
jgi:hypothetical protein